MDLLMLERSLELVGPDPVVVAAFDGWTDAGEGGTAAADALRDAFEPVRLGAFPSDALYDYRDRRPALAIDQGVLGRADWPEVVVELLTPPSGPPLLLVGGPEPDFAWRALARDLTALANEVGATRYVVLGSVPGPIPHTRPVHLIATSNDTELLERVGRRRGQVIVPASCQVALESEFAEAA